MIKLNSVKRYPSSGRLMPFAMLLIFFVTISTAFGQEKDSRSKNIPYSPSPVGKIKENEPPVATVAQGTLNLAKNANFRSFYSRCKYQGIHDHSSSKWHTLVEGAD